jgi:hypothetical protein
MKRNQRCAFHPDGWAKRISDTTDQSSRSLHPCGVNEVQNDLDTMSGSSGAPIISAEDGTVIALHHCCGWRGMALAAERDAEQRNKAINIKDMVED